jgi:recombination protein RecT
MHDRLQELRPQIDMALPVGMTADRFARCVWTAIRAQPKLLEASPESVLAGVMVAAQMGLEPGPLGHVYLVPFKVKGRQECQLIIGYKGYVHLARRSEGIAVVARAVHEGDEFQYAYGLDERLIHVPSDNPGPLTHTYAVARAADGQRWFRVLHLAEIEQRKARSRSAHQDTSPWKTDYEAMSLKSAVRALVPFLPLSSLEASQAAEADGGVMLGMSTDSYGSGLVSADVLPEWELPDDVAGELGAGGEPS